MIMCKNQLPNAKIKMIMKSHILAANTLAKIDVLVGQSNDAIVNESKTCLERRRSIEAKDKIRGEKNTNKRNQYS